MIAVLGAGVMGETFIAGLLATDLTKRDLVISEKFAARAAEISAKYGVAVVDAADAVSRSDIVLIVVKPNDIPELLQRIAPSLRPGTIVVSLAAGVSIAALSTALGSQVICMRAMPNTPALVGAGMTVLSVDERTSDADRDRIMLLLSSVGEVACLPESSQDAVTAISGSGPAYVFAFMEAMERAGVMMGLPNDIARTLVTQTVYGAATLALESGTDPGELRRRVTSPGGTTQAALSALTDGGFDALVQRATQAARDRSRELGSSTRG
ncbi:MAG: pyrroline-5-carboxylate reductase [Candidatus Nanopelagicales bacterium]